MAEFSIDVSCLPEDVREKLAELDLELSEGESRVNKQPEIPSWKRLEFLPNFFNLKPFHLKYISH